MEEKKRQGWDVNIGFFNATGGILLQLHNWRHTSDLRVRHKENWDKGLVVEAHRPVGRRAVVKRRVVVACRVVAGVVVGVPCWTFRHNWLGEEDWRR